MVALIDSDVLIAAVAQSHEHHAQSLALLNGVALAASPRRRTVLRKRTAR